MSRRRLEEAILRSKALESSGESVDEGSDDDECGRYAELFVRHRIPLTKDSHSIYSLRFSPSGKQLAVGFGNGAIQIVNAESGGLDGTLFSGHRTRQAITSLSYHPINGSILVAAGADGLISFYDTKSELNVLSLTEQENEIHALDFSMDGRVFATAGKDRHIRLYDSQTNEILNVLTAPDFLIDDEMTLTSGHTRRIFALKFHPSEHHIFVTGGWDDSIKIVNAESGGLDGTLFSGHRTRQAITSLSYHPINGSILVAAGADGLISFYDTKSQLNVLSLTEQENEIHALDFSMDGRVFATAGKDRHIRLYDSQTNEILNVLTAPDFLIDDEMTLTSGHTRRVFALKFHPSEHHIFVTGGWDDSIKVWDKRMAKEARRLINGPHICGPGIDIRNHQILSGSWAARNALQLWDMRSSSLIQDVPFPAPVLQGEFLYAARFCTDHVVLAGGSGTCSARAVNLKTQEVLGEVSLGSKAVQTVDAAPGGQVMAVGGVGGNLHIAELC